jgi:hypothetical protein
MTVLSVVITFVRVKIKMRVVITLCVHESHSCVSLSHSLVSYSHANYSRVSGNHTLRVKSHSACGNRSLHV